VLVSPRGGSILVAGRSGSGKSTAVSGILEQLMYHEYQFCLVDPEGDYEGFTSALPFGSAKEAPEVKAILRALESPRQNVLVNLLGVSVEDRPGFLVTLLPHIQDLRSRTARPHWLVIDEAHHLLPSSWSPVAAIMPQVLESTILVTVHPEHVGKAALSPVDVVIAIGESAGDVFSSFANVLQIKAPIFEVPALDVGESLIWFRNADQAPIHVKTVRSSRERLRHLRQYAEGELSPHQSFFFRGPESKLNLRAQNLRMFLQLAEGVDDETWTFHLRRNDYSEWFKTMIKDEELARQAAQVERDPDISAQQSRDHIRQAVESRYTAPA
jgi:energy-coupling factor transporter ATP-binding protein EcfA2